MFGMDFSNERDATYKDCVFRIIRIQYYGKKKRGKNTWKGMELHQKKSFILK